MTDPAGSAAPPLPPGPASARWRTWAGAAVIAIAGLAAYANSFHGPFIFDDLLAIRDNPAIRHLGSALRILPPAGDASLTTAGRPVFSLSVALNQAISGDEVWSYHALNLAIHILAGLALFGVARRTFGLMGRGAAPGGCLWPAFATALIWTVHPLQTESVTYIVQRTESLMGLFYLLTLYCFIRSASAPRRAVAWAALSVACCLLGMATKEVMATAPLIVLLHDRTFIAGSFREAWRRRGALHASLAATWIPLGWFVLKGGGNRGGTIGIGVGVSPWGYGLTQFEAVGRYLMLAVWPHPLVFEYGTFWVARARDVLPWAAVVVPLAAAAAWAQRRAGAAGFAGAWFLVILAPTSLVPGTTQMIVEHRMYLPLAAAAALFVCGTGALAGLAREKGARRAAAACRFGAPLAIAGLLGFLTHERNGDYRSDLSIWTDTVARRPENVRARMHRGSALVRLGRPAEAAAEYAGVLRIDPDHVDALDALGVVLSQQGRVAEAIGCYEKAVRLAPFSAESHNDLGIALGQVGRQPEAIGHLREALRLKPDFAEAHNNLGTLFAQSGRLPAAIGEFEAALRINPGFPDARRNLQLALRDAGRLPGGAAPPGGKTP